MEPVSLSSQGVTERLAAELVSANYFDVLESSARSWEGASRPKKATRCIRSRSWS